LCTSLVYFSSFANKTETFNGQIYLNIKICSSLLPHFRDNFSERIQEMTATDDKIIIFSKRTLFQKYFGFI
jgi:hypothetical protein